MLNRGNCRWLVHLNGIIFLNLNEICNMKHYYLLSKLHKLSNFIAGYVMRVKGWKGQFRITRGVHVIVHCISFLTEYLKEFFVLKK